MLENLQTDYKQLYSIFLHGLIKKVTKVAMKWWFIRTNNAEVVPESSPACLGDWGQDAI